MDILTKNLTRLELMDFLAWLGHNHFAPNPETFNLWKKESEIEPPADKLLKEKEFVEVKSGDSKNLAILVKEYFRFTIQEGFEARHSGLKGKILDEIKTVLGSTN